MKKITEVILTAVLLVSLCINVYSSDLLIKSGECGERMTWTFEFDSGKLVIEGEGDMWDFNGDEPWYRYMHMIEYVEICEGVTGVGSYAFDHYPNIIKVSLPETLKRIGERAFAYCVGIEADISLYTGLESIGKEAFLGTPIEKIYLPQTLIYIGEGAFRNTRFNDKQLILPRGVVRIEAHTFDTANDMDEDYSHIVIHEDVEYIGEDAFSDEFQVVDYLGSAEDWKGVTLISDEPGVLNGTHILRCFEDISLAEEYPDVTGDEWYAHKIKFVGKDKRIIVGQSNGKNDNLFGGTGLVSRAELATIIKRTGMYLPLDRGDNYMQMYADVSYGADYPYRRQGNNYMQMFADVSLKKWYTSPIMWVYANGIMFGTTVGTFEPEGLVTREQLITVLYRLNSVAFGYEDTDASVLKEYSDAGDVSLWASEGMAWAVRSGLMKGRVEETSFILAPKEYVTRAELAVIIDRYLVGSN